MSKMMMGQITHARERVAQIKRDLIGSRPEPKESYDTADLVRALSDGTEVFTGPQLQTALAEWVIAYRENGSNYNHPSIEGIVLGKAFRSELAADKKRFDTENAVYQARVKAANLEATKVEDAIVLGDNRAALDALTAFAAFKLS